MTAQTQLGPDGVCRGQEHGQYRGLAWAHVGCTFLGSAAPSPVPVAPAPDSSDEPAGAPWRVGGNYNLHAYADEPWDVDPSKDRPVATFHRPADAALAVARVNAHAALTARAELAEAEVERLTEAVDMWKRREDKVLVERDAARADLAAANTTDGLGLAEAHVGQPIDNYTPVYVEGVYDRSVQAWRSTDALRRDAAAAVALLRARLAQEAPTTKDEDRG